MFIFGWIRKYVSIGFSTLESSIDPRGVGPRSCRWLYVQCVWKAGTNGEFFRDWFPTPPLIILSMIGGEDTHFGVVVELYSCKASPINKWSEMIIEWSTIGSTLLGWPGRRKAQQWRGAATRLMVNPFQDAGDHQDYTHFFVGDPYKTLHFPIVTERICQRFFWHPFEAYSKQILQKPKEEGRHQATSLLQTSFGAELGVPEWYSQEMDMESVSRWWFQTFFMFTLNWGNDPIWLIFFKWVETTN